MYLLLLGVIAVGAGLLLIYYSVRDKKSKKAVDEEWNPPDKGKVIYLFDDDQDGSGFNDPKTDKSSKNNASQADNNKKIDKTEKDKKNEESGEETQKEPNEEND